MKPKELITLEEIERFPKNYKAYWRNSKYIGEFLKDVDGFYLYYPVEENYGGWNQSSLQALADTITELNQPWEEQIESQLNSLLDGK